MVERKEGENEAFSFLLNIHKKINFDAFGLCLFQSGAVISYL